MRGFVVNNVIKKLFLNRTAVIATMHKKEQVIAPILEKELGINIIVPELFDTDRFGTFTNEVERVGDQLQAARNKAESAMKPLGIQIGIASEGSFGPHSVVPFISFNRELIVLIDKEHELEITGYAANTNTNFAHKEVTSFEEALEFANSKGFPEHGMIVRNSEEIMKGIIDNATLSSIINEMLNKSLSSIFIETDMRAMYNPTRMKNIELATRDLVSKINSLCPVCSTPGFEVIEYKKGLPCEYCSSPTDLILAQLFTCKKCDYIQEVMYPNGIEKADPSRCNICNP